MGREVEEWGWERGGMIEAQLWENKQLQNSNPFFGVFSVENFQIEAQLGNFMQ